MITLELLQQFLKDVWPPSAFKFDKRTNDRPRQLRGCTNAMKRPTCQRRFALCNRKGFG